MGWSDGDRDIIMLYNGRPLHTHGPNNCDRPCPIHAPSDHHMKTWEHMWVATQKMLYRVCPCGVPHPDPDDYQVRFFGWDAVPHACCNLNCCQSGGTVDAPA